MQAVANPQGQTRTNISEINPSEVKFDLYAQRSTPAKQTQKIELETKILTRMVEQEITTGKNQPQTTSQSAAASANSKIIEHNSSLLFGGISEDLYREAKKRNSCKVQQTNSGSMKEVDCREDGRQKADPKKDKKHREFMFDLMSLLSRLGLIKRR